MHCVTFFSYNFGHKVSTAGVIFLCFNKAYKSTRGYKVHLEVLLVPVSLKLLCLHKELCLFVYGPLKTLHGAPLRSHSTLNFDCLLFFQLNFQAFLCRMITGQFGEVFSCSTWIWVLNTKIWVSLVWKPNPGPNFFLKKGKGSRCNKANFKEICF